MKFESSILIGFVLIVVSLAAAQDDRRIIRADRQEGGDDSSILELIGLTVGGRSVAVNEIFVADENWLKQLKITVKNVSNKNLRCVGVSMGVLDGLDTKLGPHESWGWKVIYTNGLCSKLKTSNHVLRGGESVDLIWYPDPLVVPDRTPWPTFHKAVLIEGFANYKPYRKDGNFHDFQLILPPNTKFLIDDSY